MSPSSRQPGIARRRSAAPIQAVPDPVSGARIELRQLRYFVTLAEELHFGRAAAREHIAVSALSSQVRRLERAVGVQLVERTTRHVALTAAGEGFVIEARQILEHVDRAAILAQGMASAAPTLRVGVLDEGYDAIRPVLRAVQARHPELEIHQVQAGVPEQCRLLADGRLDVGVGRLSAAAPTIASELFRLDRLGVLVPVGHDFARLPRVGLTALGDQTLLFADEERAPEFAQFVTELCRSAGFFPTLFHGSVQTLRAATDLVAQGRCILCTPASRATESPELTWRPLAPAAPRYPWSLLWRAHDPSRYVSSLVATARRMSLEHGWREVPTEIAS
jgi:DNA-binding transcriptional LysR family regulator